MTIKLHLRKLILGLAIIGLLATSLLSVFSVAGSPASLAQSAASAVVTQEQAEAVSCEVGWDRHFNLRVCTAWRATYLGNGWYKGWVYVYSLGKWYYVIYYDYLYSPNIYIR